LAAKLWFPVRRTCGFTLIEVIGALVIFSVGVLMVLQLSGALGTQMRYAAARSEIAVLGNERLDSLEATPFDSLAAGTTAGTVTVGGTSYSQSVVVTAITPVLYQIDVTLSPSTGSGPSYAVTSYTSAVWED
jgi:prepilin-type N-terminal cleavage/methylation domain-containing protein